MKLSRSLRTAALLPLLLLASTWAAQAADITVWVGYADNLRPSGFFPSPWLGDPGVSSESSSSQTFDTAAVRIDNSSGAAITISDFKVTLPAGGVDFTIWGNLTIAPGASGIFAQTASYNFDASDFGIFGAAPPAALAPNNFGGNGNTSLIGGCSSPAALIAAAGFSTQCADSAPVISFLANGGAQSFVDSGHILDTGSWDFLNNSAYGEDGNESINWNLVGTAPLRGGTLPVPEPATYALMAFGLAALSLKAGRRRGSARR